MWAPALTDVKGDIPGTALQTVGAAGWWLTGHHTDIDCQQRKAAADFLTVSRNT